MLANNETDKIYSEPELDSLSDNHTTTTLKPVEIELSGLISQKKSILPQLRKFVFCPNFFLPELQTWKVLFCMNFETGTSGKIQQFQEIQRTRKLHLGAILRRKFGHSA